MYCPICYNDYNDYSRQVIIYYYSIIFCKNSVKVSRYFVNTSAMDVPATFKLFHQLNLK